MQFYIELFIRTKTMDDAKFDYLFKKNAQITYLYVKEKHLFLMNQISRKFYNYNYRM